MLCRQRHDYQTTLWQTWRKQVKQSQVVQAKLAGVTSWTLEWAWRQWSRALTLLSYNLARTVQAVPYNSIVTIVVRPQETTLPKVWAKIAAELQGTTSLPVVPAMSQFVLSFVDASIPGSPRTAINSDADLGDFLMEGQVKKGMDYDVSRVHIPRIRQQVCDRLQETPFEIDR